MLPFSISLYCIALRYALPLESETAKASPGFSARMQTAIQLPDVLLDVKASDAEVVVPASMLLCWTNATEALAWPTPKKRRIEARRVTSFQLHRRVSANVDSLELRANERYLKEEILNGREFSA